MGTKLKGLILSLDNVLVDGRSIDLNDERIQEIGYLLRFLNHRNVQPILFLNRPRIIRDVPGKTLQEFLNEVFKAQIEVVVAESSGIAMKSSGKGLKQILADRKWESNEVIYMGNNEVDVHEAINSHVLLVNVSWFHDNIEYGIRFNQPREVARFVDVFCLRDHLWEFEMHEDSLHVYALSLGGWRDDPYKAYYDNARAALKDGNENTDFWIKYLTSTIYFSGLHEKINYFAPYPGHRRGSGNEIINQYLEPFAKCFNKSYLRDILIRHADVESSHQQSSSRSLRKQLESINLKKKATNPRNNLAYASPPLKKGKTVLVVDDFCTYGHSFEAARAYIERTGASVICVACIKTFNRDYQQLTHNPIGDPYRPNVLRSEPASRTHHMDGYVVDSEAAYELKNRLDLYQNWDWPKGI